MRYTLIGMLLLVGCGGELGSALVDAGPAGGDAAEAPALVEVTSSASARGGEAFSPTVGNPCEPSFRCNVPLPPAEGCECVPPVRYPEGTASVGAFCEPTARRCCAWYVVSPVPFTRWENCGDGWKCTGERCP